MLADQVNLGPQDPVKDFVFIARDWFGKKFAKRMDGRFPTMKSALNLFLQRGGKTIVETGCVRLKDDFGAGYSTVLFCEVLAKYGGHLWSIDISQQNINTCASLTAEWNQCRDLICADSVATLKNHPQLPAEIDFLYLDSYDYPYGDILNEYGGRVNIEAAIETTRDISDEEILKKFSSVIDPCQQHCLNELQAALPRCHDKTVLLIDDNNFPGGGKSRVAKQWLRDSGSWECIFDHQQTLWIKK